MNEQIRAAAFRSLIYVAIAGLGSANLYLVGTQSGREALASFCVGLIAVLGRLGEGAYDSHRDATGNVKRGDVGAAPPPIADPTPALDV